MFQLIKDNPEIFIRFTIVFLISLPILIGVMIYQNNRNRMRHIFITFCAPDGTTRKVQVKIGVSWTIYFFGGWALLFRNQFKEWLILFFSSLFITAISTTLLANDSLRMRYNLLILSFLLLGYTLLKDYYILIGNRTRLQKLYKSGYSFDNGLNEDVQGIYDYIKVSSTDQAQHLSEEELKPLAKNEVQGASHRYVVPDKKVAKDDSDDYSNLTAQDLKLLLRTDGISFDVNLKKEELLKIVEENAKKNKVSDEVDDDYSNLTLQDLKLLLKSEGVVFDPSSKKEELLQELKDNRKSNIKKADSKKTKEKKSNNKEIDSLSSQELKDLLTKEGISFKSGLKKDELKKLLKENKKED